MKSHEFPLLAAVFLDLIGFGMIIPDIQLRLEHFGSPGYLIGAILASMFIVQSLVSSAWGQLGDRLGRKTVFVACTMLSASSMLVYALATNSWLLLASRILAGLGAANVAVAQAGVTEQSDDSDRAAILGRLTAALSAGLLVGPALGGFVSYAFGSAMVGWAGMGCSLLGALLVLLFARLHPGSRNESRQTYSFIPLLRSYPSVIPLAALSTVAWFALACLEGTFGRLIEHNLGYGPLEFGIVFSYESLLGLIIPAFALAWLVKTFSERKLLRIAFLAQAVGLGLTPLAPGLGWLLALSTFVGFGQGSANPTIHSLASELVPEARRGELFGVFQSIRSLGFILGPIAGGRLFDWHPAAPYLLAGAVCLLAAILVPVAFPPGPCVQT